MSASDRSSAGGAPVELDDIQGLLRFGYKHHTEASFLLLRVHDAAAARAWLAQVSVTSAVSLDPVPARAIQIGLSRAGLDALGVPAAIVGAFSAEFVGGLGTDAARARRLGDTGPNDPSHWRWGTGTRVPHALVMLYALPGRLADWQREVLAQCADGFDLVESLPTVNLRGREPFGFVDGISQPELDWQRRRPVRDEEQLAYDNLGCLGEFLLGYPNEYGLYTDRPLLGPEVAEAALLPRAEDEPGRADLGRNGSYLVLRQLHQDVPGFWRHLDHEAGGDTIRREQLAAALLGRTLAGVPLAERASAHAAEDLNAFDYAADPAGRRCPLGAHVRRTNPRNADLPPGRAGLWSWLMRTLGFDAAALERDRVASTRFHRLLRRGREYGAALSIDEALKAGADAVESGIHFVCLGANLARQFEFVQGAWVASAHFDGLRHESDPLLGTREPLADGSPTDRYSLPQVDAADRLLSRMPAFVRVVGGAYFFLPGIRALRCLAALR